MNKDIEKLLEISDKISEQKITNKSDIRMAENLINKIVISFNKKPKKYFKRII